MKQESKTGEKSFFLFSNVVYKVLFRGHVYREGQQS